MPSLPIPMFSALVLGFLLIRLLVVDPRHGPLAMLLALGALQGLIISRLRNIIWQLGRYTFSPLQPV